MLIIWLVLIAVFVAVEIATLGLTTVWFAAGSLVAFIAGFFGAGFEAQLIVFFVVSIILVFFVRPSACKKFNSSRIKTNADSLIGVEGKVLETIDNFNQKGNVFLDGKEWTARSVDDSIIQSGERVVVVEISGVKLIVTKKEAQNVQMKKEEA